MARVLVLGGGGMLGHKVYQVLHERCDTWATLRGQPPAGAALLFDPARTITDVDVLDLRHLEEILRGVGPSVVINCVGVVKQLAEARDPVAAISINALFPHQLYRSCRAIGARVIHISTDCVFSGRRGHYSETDMPDATDLYGRTKLLGEVIGEGALTIRTSIIGRELRGATGLLEWFLTRRNATVDGYRRAKFSGLTTAALAGVLATIVESYPSLSGLYHAASAPITKLELLERLNAALGVKAAITPSDAVTFDRTLDGERLRKAVAFEAPTWDSMIASLAADRTPYDEWRRGRVA